MAESNTDALAQIDILQARYARALDGRDMKKWAECFHPNLGGYECKSREDHEAGNQLAMMLDDSPARIKDRVKAVDEVWAGTFEDYFTRHFVQRLHAQPVGAGRWSVESNFMVTFTSGQDGNTRILLTGSYFDEVMMESSASSFISRKAIFDSDVIPRYLVYPV